MKYLQFVITFVLCACITNGAESTRRPPSANALRRLTRDLYRTDTNSVGDQITINVQERTSSNNQRDVAPRKLFQTVPAAVLRGTTVAALSRLLDNYNRDVRRPETSSAQERREETQFRTAISSTPVMVKAGQFLTSQGLTTAPIASVLNTTWFTPYSRSGNVLGSSGFEHVFVGEIKNAGVTGFHNWVKLYLEENEGRANYYGYIKKKDLGPKIKLVSLKFKWHGKLKNFGSVFIGISPELEMALYTVCFLARPNQLCPVELGGQRFNVKTHVFNGKLGSAYPLLP